MNVEKRTEIERKVIRKLIRLGRKHGFFAVRVWDGEASVLVRTEREVMGAVFAVDEATIKFRHVDGGNLHAVCCVMGNGFDVISDSSMDDGGPWDQLMAEITSYCNQLEMAE